MTEVPKLSLQRTSTAEAVAEAVMGMIVNGTLRAGEHLRETNMAEMLGISRNSVREGLRLLEQSRLVKYEVHRGAVVSTPTVNDLDDLYRTRLHLETLAASSPASDTAVSRVAAAFDALASEGESHDAERIVAADIAFHQSIVELLESERISSFSETLGKELVFYLRVLSHTDAEYLNPEATVIDDHRPIRDAIVEGRHEDAAELLRTHITSNFARLRDILVAREQDASTI